MNAVKSSIRVLIADDHTLVREGLRQLLAATADIRVEAEAADGDEALALVKANDYDLAVLDMSMPGLSGIELIKRLRVEKPRLRLLAGGLGPTEIGAKLHLSVKTVSTHKTRILDKLNLGSAAELVRYALENKLV